MKSYRPTSLADAIEVIGDDVTPVAGATDLLVVDHVTGRQHGAVVDLSRIPELRGIHLSGDAIDIGAAVTFFEIREHAGVRTHLPCLAQAAATIGAWQIQNRATIGGNIANASPAGDSLPVLLAVDAEVVVCGRGGERRIPYEQMHTGYRRTALAEGELIVRVQIPRRSRSLQVFRKVGTREAQAISKVVLAFCADVRAGVLQQVRIAVGSVAATPVRLTAVEALLEGQRADSALAEAAGKAAESEISPIDDVRSTAEYRKWVTRRLVRRTVLETVS